MLNHEALGNDLDRMALITQPFINICAAAEILRDFPTDEMVEVLARAGHPNFDDIATWHRQEVLDVSRDALNAVRNLIFE